MQEQIAAELAALETETEQPGPAQFTLNFLWLDKNIAVSVDQLFDQVVLVRICVRSTFASFYCCCSHVLHCTAYCSSAWSINQLMVQCTLSVLRIREGLHRR